MVGTREADSCRYLACERYPPISCHVLSLAYIPFLSSSHPPSFLQALSVGIFPYVLKLLQTSAVELRQVLVFIWAKILPLDKVGSRLKVVTRQ